MSATALSFRTSAPDRTARVWWPRRRLPAPGLAERVTLDLAAAEDVHSGMARAVAMLRREGGATRVEWWVPTEDGTSARLVAADGRAFGRRITVPVGPAGVVVLTGDLCGSQLVSVVRRLAPVLRRRYVEEQLAERAAALARQNEALEDFAALVAHELKTPLLAALQQADVSAGVECALDIVDGLLEFARGERAKAGFASPAECLQGALDDLGPLSVKVSSRLPGELPLPPVALRLLLRNLVANAVAAGALHIQVTCSSTAEYRMLVVDDDGVGLADTGRYAGGSGLGLRLCRRVASRFGAELGLGERVGGGTRATLSMARA